jgi:hypothetical protein
VHVIINGIGFLLCVNVAVNAGAVITGAFILALKPFKFVNVSFLIPILDCPIDCPHGFCSSDRTGPDDPDTINRIDNAPADITE